MHCGYKWSRTEEMLMKIKLIIVTLVFAAAVLLASHGLAETIYLKNGTVINEKIVERGSYYVITMTGKKPSRYFLSEIDYIEEDEVEHVNIPAPVDLSKYEDIAEDKVRLIFNYIDVAGVRTNMEQNIKLAIDRAPEDEKEKYEALFNVNEIIERLIPIYSKYYSKVDLINMIKFYESPTGVNVLESTPEIMKESVDVSIQYIKENITP